ncbi:hypothetical protein B0H15DRAFT_846429 [Mycena belliarum]|uniref:DUF3835 domain-containing protein n=1 Tax=Mycena belliarum TaxID=1033014 RepID=A0AAD6XQP9_9AGAR|nr:hypothetical protein B0H15DRAFT_846429 [Mycena belliae]
MAAQTRNLNDGSAQALQALLNSLTPGAPVEGGRKLSTADVQKLSEKLKELVGDSAGESNDEGQLLNEEGLPIIDITEPLQALDSPLTSTIPEEEPPIPIAVLPLSEQERLRRERDQILDMLEEEEQAERAKVDASTQEQRQEILRKRKKAAQDELDRLKAAKDMHKKMGKALLRGLSTPGEENTSTAPSVPVPDPAVAVESYTPTPRKSVKFADAAIEVETPLNAQQSNTPDWGDVVPARLRPNSGRFITNAQSDAHPMKMQVVERIPGKHQLDRPQPDSDDESEPPESPTAADSEEDEGFMSDEGLAEEADVDYAQHQREILLEYHTKRAKMAETTSDAMKSHAHAQDSVSHTPDDSLNQPARKPAISHFQANRLTSSYNAAVPASSKSLGAHVLPASSARTLQRAIRVGKLDSENRLVGGEAGESESGEDEEDAGMQEIRELLQKGEVYNLGPEGNFIHTVPPSKAPPGAPAVATSDPPPRLSSSRKPPTSKFKLARGGARPIGPLSPNISAALSPTPPFSATRSSPNLPSDSPTPVLSSVVEKPSSLTAPFASMIIDSPSFPAEGRRLDRPPTVRTAADSEKPVKVSRFLAERM